MTQYDYEGKLRIAEKDIKSGRCEYACQSCGKLFEQYIKDIFEDVANKSDVGEQFFLEKKVKNINGFGDINKFTLGELLALYYDENFISLAERLLNIEFRIKNYINQKQLNALRNHTSHSGYDVPTTEQATFFLLTIKTLLQEAKYIKGTIHNLLPKRCPKCKKEVTSEQLFCQYCSEPILSICLKCGTKLNDDCKFCPQCNTRTDLENKIKDLKNLLIDAFEEDKNCPICGAEVIPSDFDVDEDKDSYIIKSEYDHYCDCKEQIQKILIARNINIDIPHKLKEHIYSLIFDDKLFTYQKVYVNRQKKPKNPKKYTLEEIKKLPFPAF